MMNCPQCKHELTSFAHKDVEIDYCKSCRGIWFDRDEAKALSHKINYEPEYIPKEIKSIGTSASKETYNCPKCRTKVMDKKVYDDIAVNICPQCWGIWLDKGQYHLILRRYKQIFSHIKIEKRVDQFVTTVDIANILDLASYCPDSIIDGTIQSAEAAAEAGASIIEFVVGIVSS